MSRPATNGPRSLILTTALRPDRGLISLTIDPKGKLGWAAVDAVMSYSSPLAVARPWKVGPYQLAAPYQTLMGGTGWVALATKGASREGAMAENTNIHAREPMSTASLFRIVCYFSNKSEHYYSTPGPFYPPLSPWNETIKSLIFNSL